jgi:hypothetical protein
LKTIGIVKVKRAGSVESKETIRKRLYNEQQACLRDVHGVVFEGEKHIDTCNKNYEAAMAKNGLPLIEADTTQGGPNIEK